MICALRSRATGTRPAVTTSQPQSALVVWQHGFSLLHIPIFGQCHHLGTATVLAFAFLVNVVAPANEPCAITIESGSFAIVSILQDPNNSTTITWESCTNYIYGVVSSDQLDMSAFWSGQIAMWGEASTTSWTDATATNINQRFYRVVRMPADGDFDNDEMPNAWELQYGLNLFDPNDAQTDFDGDNVDNLTEYLQGRDPTKEAVADGEGLVNLNVFTPLE